MAATFTDLRDRGGERARGMRRLLRRRVLAHRRLLAFLCAAAAVLVGVLATRPPAPPSDVVLVAARDLPSGTVLAAADLTEVAYADGTAPTSLDPRPLGRTLAAPLRRGEAVTDVRLVSPTLAEGYPGLAAYPVRIPDADAVALLRVGDRIDVLATDPESGEADVVLTDAPVLALPATDQSTRTEGLAGRLVVLGVPETRLADVGGVAATQFLSVVLSR
ncbi:SAF domain-containing protein [Nocardioides sp. LHG3406-4]|uniref:SAF domain-containing protein n=1 Tax=Nocardioides sp. LHG3406-4 TaxID=2804575 RepID=UPI003CEB6B22